MAQRFVFDVVGVADVCVLVRVVVVRVVAVRVVAVAVGGKSKCDIARDLLFLKKRKRD